MAFKLSTKPTYNFLVTIRQPDEAGKWAAFEFRAVFKRLDADQVRDIMKTPPDDDALLARVWEGWVPADVKDPDGNQLEVTDANRTVMLAVNGMRRALCNAWLESCVTGLVKN